MNRPRKWSKEARLVRMAYVKNIDF